MSDFVIDESFTVGFIGAGNIAKSMASCIMGSGNIDSKQMWVSAPTFRDKLFWENLDVNVTYSNDDVFKNCKVIFLAMKPHHLPIVVSNLTECIENKIVVSFLAGVSLKTLHEALDVFMKQSYIMRVMPNTPMQVSSGCSILCAEDGTPEECVKLVKTLMRTGGVCEQLPENLMNAGGALIASGPAFIFTVIEALADAAVKQGLPRSVSYELASHMVRGSAEMILQLNLHPALLKDGVCSPGGTTIAGMHAIESGGLRGIMMNAIEAATKRSFELDM